MTCEFWVHRFPIPGKTRAALGLAVICAAHFLIAADGLAVAIALPNLQEGLGTTAIDAQCALTAFGLAFGGVLLLTGRLGDLYGRRRLFVYGMATFAGGSLPTPATDTARLTHSPDVPQGATAVFGDSVVRWRVADQARSWRVTW